MRDQKRSHSRRGATLMEVLIAILAMGIGVVSLISLFPLSVVRSVRGYQLTQSTIHRQNAEAIIDGYPRLFADPDNDGNLQEHWGERFVVDPLGNLEKFNLRGLYSPSGATYPPAAAADVIGVMRRFSGMRNDANNNAFLNDFLNLTDSHEAAADSLATMPDTWVEQVDEITQINTGTNEITFDSAVSLTAVAGALTATPAIPVRAIIYDTTGKQSVTRSVTNINLATNVATYSPDLPTGFSVGNRIVLETLERRFTWMLTCRGTTPLASDFYVDVTVFFRRPYSAEEETPVVLETANNVAVLFKGSYTAYIDYPETENAPHIRKGGYLFDCSKTGANWYRVVDWEDFSTPTLIPGTTVTTKHLKVTLDRAAIDDSSLVVIMNSAVDFYPLGLKSYRP
ncbi:MAG: hypothetical protein KDA68_05905 [Planctomycetaceae bacterium]|nr:hypothetical protein [Planctomycetaceae bacterium]